MREYRKVGTDTAMIVIPVDADGNAIGGGTGGGGTPKTDYERVMSANDLQWTYAYNDVGTPDQRVVSITMSSAIVGKTVTETVTYGGSSGNYYPLSKARVVS